MNDSDIRAQEWDDDWDYDLKLWIKTTKSLEELETSVAHVIQPVRIVNHQFDVGGVKCEFVTPAGPAPAFPGVPIHAYQHAIIIPTTIAGIWGWIDKPLAIGLVIHAAGRFELTWMLVADELMFVACGEHGSPILVNHHYSDREFGEYARLLMKYPKYVAVDIPAL